MNENVFADLLEFHRKLNRLELGAILEHVVRQCLDHIAELDLCQVAAAIKGLQFKFCFPLNDITGTRSLFFQNPVVLFEYIII